MKGGIIYGKQIFHSRNQRQNNAIDNKGIVVAATYDAAKQGYHAYLGFYAYGHDENTDFVSCMITDKTGAVLMAETWIAPAPVEAV